MKQTENDDWKGHWQRVIFHERHQYVFQIVDNFPEEDIQALKEDLASLGEEGWLAWMTDHHADILAFLADMPKACGSPLDYKNNARLYCAVLYSFRRGLQMLELLEFVGLVEIRGPLAPEFYKQLAAAADARYMQNSLDTPSLWPFSGLPPFAASD